jgi:hypothetical protein
MKKMILFFSVAVLLFATSCTKTAIDAAAVAETKSIADEPTSNVAAVGEAVTMEYCVTYNGVRICNAVQCTVTATNDCTSELEKPTLANLRPIVKPTGTNIHEDPLAVSLFTQLFNKIRISQVVNTQKNTVSLVFRSISPSTSGAVLLIREATYAGANKFVSNPLQTTSSLSINMLQTTVNNPTLANLTITIGEMYKPLKFTFTYDKLWF